MEFDDENIIINNIDDDVADTLLVSCTLRASLQGRSALVRGQRDRGTSFPCLSQCSAGGSHLMPILLVPIKIGMR